MTARFSGRNLALSGQWAMPPTHAIDARHTLDKLQETRSSVYRRGENVAVVHRAHRALEKAEIASGAFHPISPLLIVFARAASWCVEIPAEKVLTED